MIAYTSQRPWTLIRFRGSVVPKAMAYSAISAALGFIIKVVDERFDGAGKKAIASGVCPRKLNNTSGYIGKSCFMTSPSAYAVFTATLTFLLVFRTVKCYDRFWQCATSICCMRSQMSEASSSLMCFALMSKKDKSEIREFRQKLVRLFSLLHACCLTAVTSIKTMGLTHDASIGDVSLEQYEIIGLDGFEEKYMELLRQKSVRDRVTVTYTWINAFIIKNLESGLLNVPPPILSRVFQEMEKSMVEYQQVLQVMTVPFPFPYTQAAFLMLIMVTVSTPFVMLHWTNNPIFTAFFSLLTVSCFATNNLISNELENPFGGDDNDLPCKEFQEAMNDGLLIQLRKETQTCPKLIENYRPLGGEDHHYQNTSILVDTPNAASSVTETHM